jgi:hypothetical protein
VRASRTRPGRSGPRLVGIVVDDGPDAPAARARLEQDLVGSTLFSPVRAELRRPAPGSDPVRAALGLAEELVRQLRFGRGLELCLWSTTGGEALRRGPALLLAARLAELPLVAAVRDEGLAAALDRAAPLARVLFSRALSSLPLVLLPTRAERRRLADLPNARWLPATLAEGPPPAPRPAPARLAIALAEEAQLARCVQAFAAAGAAGARVSLLLPAGSAAQPAELPSGWVQRALPERGSEARAALLAEHGALALLEGGAQAAELGLAALRAGRALLAPPCASLSDLCAGERTGLVLEGAPEPALASAWKRLAAEPETLARLASGARLRGAGFERARWRERLEDWLFQICDQGALSRTRPAWETLPDEEAGPALRQSA